MANVKDDDYFVEKIKIDLEYITEHMFDLSIDDFYENELLQDAMMFRMIQLSENAKRLTNNYKMIHNEIPWNAIYGLRNRIVHDYGNVDLNIVYETLKEDIPNLLANL